MIITDVRGRKIGLELTEWLDKEQTRISISKQENEMKWLDALDIEHSPPPVNFRAVQIWFNDGTRFSERQEPLFRKEFHGLINRIDSRWTELMANEPNKFWDDFSDYPTLRKHVLLLAFQDRWPYRPSRWVISTPKGGAYDPERPTNALLHRIEEKKKKENYTDLKTKLSLSELDLLVHYGLRGMIHNTPFRGLGKVSEDAIYQARVRLASDPGPFDRVFLYLAYNEGQLFTLYPRP